MMTVRRRERADWLAGTANFAIAAPLDYICRMYDDESGAQQLAALKLEHRALDEQIAALVAHGSSDQLEIARLKKRKLRLKDEIERMRDRSVPDIIA